jgi:hypothetical protein
VLLEDLVDLYRRVFARIQSREDAKASPYARYYIAISTPMSWKHIMTVFGGVLESKGKLEDATAHSIPISVVPPPSVWRWPYYVPMRRTDNMYHTFSPQGIDIPWCQSARSGRVRQGSGVGAPISGIGRLGRRRVCRRFGESNNNSSLSRICTNTLFLFGEYSHV